MATFDEIASGLPKNHHMTLSLMCPIRLNLRIASAFCSAAEVSLLKHPHKQMLEARVCSLLVSAFPPGQQVWQSAGSHACAIDHVPLELTR